MARILWAEDDDQWVRSKVDILRNKKIEVDVGSTIVNAQNFIENNLGAYSLIILDINFKDSESTGLQLYEQVRQRSSKIPIMILSAQERVSEYQDQILKLENQYHEKIVTKEKGKFVSPQSWRDFYQELEEIARFERTVDQGDYGVNLSLFTDPAKILLTKYLEYAAEDKLKLLMPRRLEDPEYEYTFFQIKDASIIPFYGNPYNTIDLARFYLEHEASPIFYHIHKPSNFRSLNKKLGDCRNQSHDLLLYVSNTYFINTEVEIFNLPEEGQRCLVSRIFGMFKEQSNYEILKVGDYMIEISTERIQNYSFSTKIKAHINPILGCIIGIELKSSKPK